MKFSIIVPSFNQENFIQQTLDNLCELKKKAAEKNIQIEILLFDSESNAAVQTVIEKYKSSIDYVEIKKDKGQYDAINKGIVKCSGDYWTWLNTDDLLDLDGFFKVVDILERDASIDYIYGGVTYIDENNSVMKTVDTWDISLDYLVTREPAIFQPGSWFKKSFTDNVGVLANYACCFDYEYILRLLKNNVLFHKCSFPVSQFRFYSNSKTGSNTVQFIKEQLLISKLYGRMWSDYLTFFLNLRLLKHFVFPRK
jgi:glycosyltransferase involved in cell wall biosynthesis